MTGHDAKRELRKAIIERRAAWSLQARQVASHSISQKLLALRGFTDAQTILGYMSFRAEFGTGEFVRAVLEQDKILVLPKVNREAHCLDLFEVRDLDRDLVAGIWGILEPDPLKCVRAEMEAIDFALVPGVAFDQYCNRIGYGGGYYDQLLEELGPFPSLVAGAFSLQIVDRVPLEEHDVSLDLVITEDQKFVRTEFMNQDP
jgi:5-formyltetrahydrofolate cyclo-ligase